MKILLVDDDPFCVSVVKRMLNNGDFKVLTAGTVDEAIDLLAFNEFHMVISDIIMPGKLGFELAEHVRSMENPIPIILITAGFENAQSDYIHMADLIADKAISKPLKRDTLLLAINELQESYSKILEGV